MAGMKNLTCMQKIILHKELLPLANETYPKQRRAKVGGKGTCYYVRGMWKDQHHQE